MSDSDIRHIRRLLGLVVMGQGIVVILTAARLWAES